MEHLPPHKTRQKRKKKFLHPQDFKNKVRAGLGKPKQVLQQPAQVRSTPIRFTEKELSKAVIDKIIRWYQHDIPLETIRQKLNGEKVSGLALCDIYAVLYTYHKVGKVEQRRTNLTTELTLDRFAWVWEQWKQGLEEQRIVDRVAVLKNVSVIGVKGILYSLKRRWKSNKAIITTTRERSSLSVLRQGKWVSFDGKIYLAIPAEVFLDEDNRMLIDVDSLEAIQKEYAKGTPTPAEKPTLDDPPPYRPDPSIGVVEFGEVAVEQKITAAIKPTDLTPTEAFDPKTWQEAQEEFMQELDEKGVPDIPQVLNQKKEMDDQEKGIPQEQLQTDLDKLLG